MKKLILPAMIAMLSLAAVTTRAQVHVDVVVHPLLPVRPRVVVVKPILRPPVVVARVYRPVIARPVVVARPVVTVVRPVRRVVVY